MILDRLLDPASIAIVGVSADQAKHGGRVLANLRKLGFPGQVWGVNPKLPEVDGLEVFARLDDLPFPPDLVVCAVPAQTVVEVVGQSEGSGGVVVFAGGYGETGDPGRRRERDLRSAAHAAGTRLLGPNSGGIIRPSRGLAASFLTCLDRPAGEIRSGGVGVVTQSGGTGSYIHNLAAARGSGLAVSISTGNELDIQIGAAIEAVAALDEVRVILAVIETVRDGARFVEAVRGALERGKPVVACRLGTGSRGQALMSSHTGAMALPHRVLDGVLGSLGVTATETPGEAYDVAEMLARKSGQPGDRAAIVTHSGGVAILLADLAERHGVELPQPGPELRSRLEPFLELGAANNPLDMGGIIGGPGRFAEVVGTFASSGEYDVVLAVSTPHPPAHTEARASGLIDLDVPVPVTHLWMAGDQSMAGLSALRAAGRPVTEEPRAAMRALSTPNRMTRAKEGSAPGHLITGSIEEWGLPLVEGGRAADSATAVVLAERLGYPVVVKAIAPGLAHKTEVGAVAIRLTGAEEVRSAFENVTSAAKSAGYPVEGVRVERFRPGLELIVGAITDPVFGPLVSVGIGGVLTELLGDVVFSPAPVGVDEARGMLDRLRGKQLLHGFRGSSPTDITGLATIVSVVSRGLVGSEWEEVELNPVIWDGEWVVVDWLAR